MSQGEIEKQNLGAPKVETEQEIHNEIESAYPFLSPEAKKALIESRLKILSNPIRPELVKADLGKNASKKAKDNLFE